MYDFVRKEQELNDSGQSLVEVGDQLFYAGAINKSHVPHVGYSKKKNIIFFSSLTLYKAYFKKKGKGTQFFGNEWTYTGEY
jgi:hypothetical protein